MSHKLLVVSFWYILIQKILIKFYSTCFILRGEIIFIVLSYE